MTKESGIRFRQSLFEEEKSSATIEKYMRDLRSFAEFMNGREEITKEQIIEYKMFLMNHYKSTSVNSMLAALNHYLEFMGWEKLKVRQVRIQRVMFAGKDEKITKKEYEQLVRTAADQGDKRMELLLQAICSTGIRISEHRFITMEALQNGYIEIYNKGKVRRVPLQEKLIRVLRRYCKKQKITSGPVFITRTGKPLDRSNVWKKMKTLCKAASVNEKKVYPHNLRHLFAASYYKAQKDLLRLAELMGHSSIETTRIYAMAPSLEQEKILSGLGLVLE